MIKKLRPLDTAYLLGPYSSCSTRCKQIVKIILSFLENSTEETELEYSAICIDLWKWVQQKLRKPAMADKPSQFCWTTQGWWGMNKNVFIPELQCLTRLTPPIFFRSLSELASFVPERRSARKELTYMLRCRIRTTRRCKSLKVYALIPQ